MEVSNMRKLLKAIFSSIVKHQKKKYNVCSYELEEIMQKMNEEV